MMATGAMNRPFLFLCGRAWTPKSFSIAIVIITVIVNEYLIYIIQSQRWPNIPVTDRDPDNVQVLLLVSDPQLQGYKDEPGFPFGAITRWDSDRFLSQTFWLAMSHTKPDAVIYLGDLMDEGSKASKEDYKYCYYRFHQIFALAQKLKNIYIPGDNDVGGEGRDFRTEEKVKRFELHFEELKGVSNHKFIDYVKLDIRTQALIYAEKRELAQHLHPRIMSPIRIVLNHETVLPQFQIKESIYTILNLLGPQLIFSGHWHKSMVFPCADCMRDDSTSWSLQRRFLPNGFIMENITQSKEFIMEVMVPTCSYRMGEPEMGYGVAVIQKNGLFHYGVLWSPSRYKVLYSYCLIGVSLVLFNLTVWMKVKRYGSQKR
ncbi:hypothetical protein FSP39_023647 [Pinctada imbricata]|uniref:Calcineurin-like phosphoesterase domain-containing protein n=1 Tax=Pinctada imbricata TaxID=66713 RepID=A0AA88Y142_PINIB|nr:hypothetical protein FSP39_023647 [Pinctada imbricata]